MTNAPRLAPVDLNTPPDPPTLAAVPEPILKRTVAAQLVDQVKQQYRLGVTPEGEPFALPRLGPRQHIAIMLRGGRTSLKAALAASYLDATGNVPGGGALSDALTAVQGLAEREPPSPLALRFAEHQGAILIDVGDATGTVIRIAAGRVTALTESPVLFRRSGLTMPLPLPEAAGEISRLWEHLNVAEQDQPILLAWLVAALMVEIPRPILTLTGEQGTGKSTAAGRLVTLLDPSTAPLRTASKNADEIPVTLAPAQVIALDNVSAISDAVSDVLCMAVTGAARVTRELYSDSNVRAVSFQRALILTGIDFAAIRGDLAERMVLVTLRRIPPAERRDDRAMIAAWNQDRPSIVGALYSLAARVLMVLPGIDLASRPRMADFASVLAAVDQIHGTSGLDRYAVQTTRLAADSLAGDSFITAVLTERKPFRGTAAELLTRTQQPEGKLPRDWPTSARQVTTRLKRAAPQLVANGWTVDGTGEDRNHSVIWVIWPPSE